MTEDLVESIFSSRVRIRILKALLKYREINITKLSKDLGINYKVLMYHLSVLERVGIVEEKRFGRVRIVRIIEGNPRVGAIERFFKEMNGGH
ncbi:ArsR/SmtB family transcription factor [Vulcanisaeta thermophila]|uniref:ArsR/SmtB family transcription factor n=1 Tax=Vulcanisaeta thermophila TaxID=867917 RepID=UPI000A013D67|nr:winged helix-turn-helix domain-containing protein [Vulcanisaeta thermophila]